MGDFNVLLDSKTLRTLLLMNCSISSCKSVAWILSCTLSSPLTRVTMTWPVPGWTISVVVGKLNFCALNLLFSSDFCQVVSCNDHPITIFVLLLLNLAHRSLNLSLYLPFFWTNTSPALFFSQTATRYSWRAEHLLLPNSNLEHYTVFP